MFGFPLFEFLMLVLGFGFLIFVHELGHFAVAKWVGIRCPQFAIGFGTAFLSWRKGLGVMRGTTEREYERRCIEKLQADGVEPEEEVPPTKKEKKNDQGDPEEAPRKQYSQIQIYNAGDALGLAETEYRLNYLPLGGYVKMMGQEDMDPTARSEHPNSYNNKPIWARACVISAGVVMNMIFGAIFLAVAFLIGVDFPKATVGMVTPGMPASTTFAEGHEGDLSYLGLQEGDVILSVNGKAPEDFKDVAIAVALSSSESVVEIEVQRRGHDQPLNFVLTPERQRGGERLLSAGFSPGPGLDVVIVDTEVPEEDQHPFTAWVNERMEAVPAEQREPGQSFRIAEVNGEAVETYADYLLAFDHSNGQPVEVTFLDQSSPDASSVFAIEPVPTLVQYPDKPGNLLGLVPAGVITFVGEETPAEEAGLLVGDILIQVGETDWPADTMSIVRELEDDSASARQFIVLRDGERVDLGEITPNRDGKFGILVNPALDSPLVSSVLEGLPAAVLDEGDGFMPGTKVTGINGQAVSDWADIQQALIGAVLEMRPTIELRVELPTGQSETTTIELDEAAADAIAAARWVPDHALLPPALCLYLPATEIVTLKADGLGDALAIGADKSRDFVLQTYVTLARLIQGDVKLYNLRGPVGIIDTGTEIAQKGLPYLLYFLGLISINLAVINFLPIPIVDGGHMVFLAWEKLTGKPPSPQVHNALLFAGLGLIGFVFIATFYFDVMRLIFG